MISRSIRAHCCIKNIYRSLYHKMDPPPLETPQSCANILASSTPAQASNKRALSDAPSPPAKVQVLPISIDNISKNEATKVTAVKAVPVGNSDNNNLDDSSEKKHLYPTFKEFARAKKYEKIDERAKQMDTSFKMLKESIMTDDDEVKSLASNNTCINDSITVTHDAATFYPMEPTAAECTNDDDVDEQFVTDKVKKKMFALLLSYSGKGYNGMQVNPPHPTIEGELLKALEKLGMVTENECKRVQAISFQRAARTDKGVSAARQVINMRLPLNDGDEGKLITKVNELLPGQISVMDILRTTKYFSSKNKCDFRTYSYLTPSFAFCPIDEVTNEEYRIKEETLDKVRKLFAQYKGCQNFHNFTIKKKPTEPNAKRYIHGFDVEEPFVRDGLEWLLLKVKGQSFMMHQIRKMVGLVIGISRGIFAPSVMLEALSTKKVDTPRAPALGLVLEQPHFVYYNSKFGNDGCHKPLDWAGLDEKTEQFRRKYIDKDIIETEIRERSMLNYIQILHVFSNDPREDAEIKGSGIKRAYLSLNKGEISDDVRPLLEDFQDTLEKDDSSQDNSLSETKSDEEKRSECVETDKESIGAENTS